MAIDQANSPMPQAASLPASLYDQIQARTAHIPVTQALIAINLLVFVAMLAAGTGLWHADNGIQLAWGANFGPATQDGQWWRLGTALFLHFGLVHIALNMWALWDGGQLVERLYGHWRFSLIYFGSGLTGNLLSLVVQGNRAVSGGASGAIFGIYGALLIYLWHERRQLHPHEFRWLFWAAAAFSSFSIGMGLVIPGIDNSAHIGGLLSGILLGLVFGRHLQAGTPWPTPLRRMAGLLLIATVAVLITRIPPPKYRWSQELAAREEIREFYAREAEITANWQRILQEDRQHPASFEQLAGTIDSELVEPYDDSFEALSKLKLSPKAPSAAQLDSLRRYSRQRRDSMRALADDLRNRGRFGAENQPRQTWPGQTTAVPKPPPSEKSH